MYCNECIVFFIVFVSHTRLDFSYSYENAKKAVATRAAPFGSDMHQMVCRMGLRPRPHWGAYSAAPDPIAGSEVGPQG